MSAHAHTMTRAEWLMLFALAALWGSSFFFFKILLTAWPPFTIVLARTALACLILNAVLIARGNPLARHHPWPGFLLLGVLNNVIPFSLIVWGETHIASGLAAILNATTPVFSVLAAHFLARGEKLTAGRAAGVALGVLGVAIISGPEALAGLGAANILAQGACLLASLSYALAGIYARRFRGLPSLQVATGQVTGAALVMLPIAALHDHAWTLKLPGPDVWAALAGLVVLCTVLAYILYFRMLATAGATNALLVTFLLPASALLLGWLVLAEPIRPAALAGMAVIGAGLAAIDGRPVARLRAALAS